MQRDKKQHFEKIKEGIAKLQTLLFCLGIWKYSCISQYGSLVVSHENKSLNTKTPSIIAPVDVWVKRKTSSRLEQRALL